MVDNTKAVPKYFDENIKVKGQNVRVLGWFFSI
jgi:hypothetical protein